MVVHSRRETEINKLAGSNYGAKSACEALAIAHGSEALELLRKSNIRESDIWVLYKDGAGRDAESMYSMLRAGTAVGYLKTNRRSRFCSVPDIARGELGFKEVKTPGDFKSFYYTAMYALSDKTSKWLDDNGDEVFRHSWLETPSSKLKFAKYLLNELLVEMEDKKGIEAERFAGLCLAARTVFSYTTDHGLAFQNNSELEAHVIFKVMSKDYDALMVRDVKTLEALARFAGAYIWSRAAKDDDLWPTYILWNHAAEHLGIFQNHEMVMQGETEDLARLKESLGIKNSPDA